MLPGRSVVRTALSEFERVYRQSHARFARVAAAITREPDAAAEAVQEAFARAIRRRAQFRGEAPLEAWIWRAVVNEAKRLAAASVPTADARAAEAATNGSPSDEAA